MFFYIELYESYIYILLVEQGMLSTIINKHNHSFKMFHLVVSYKKIKIKNVFSFSQL